MDIKKIINCLKRNKVIADIILRDKKFVYDYAVKFSKNYPEKFIPGGVSIKKEDAKRKALGEAMEIYSSTLFRQLLQKKLDIKKIKDAYKFLQFKEESYKDGFYSKFYNSKEIIWVKGKDVINKKDVLIPGFCIFLNYNKYHKRYYPNFSQGLGNARNLKDSIVHGILENIEVDASIIFWRNKLDLPLIRLNTLKDNELNLLINNLKKEEIKVNLPVPRAQGISK
ncbi:MAG: YcaO-like family protein [Candidatus Pacearchaeota archaeon]|nr:YcaO-like family protein [Candidatus Pacearchaeota archaeon]